MRQCKYGCEREAKFSLKSSNDELVCCEPSPNSCPANKIKNSQGLEIAHQEGRLPGWAKLWHEGKNKSWNKGLTKATHPSLQQAAETLSDGYTSGRIVSPNKGKHLSLEHRRKLSRSHNPKSALNGYVKTKFYKIMCPYMNKIVKVQGTWELAYANYLNDNSIPWIKMRKIKMYYLLDEDLVRTYYPDFYLPITDQYIEIKGYFWKNLAKGIDDKRKLEAVKRCNPDKDIVLLLKDDLKKLAII
jgi:hypothetical protein